MRWGTLLFQFYRRQNWNTQWLSNLPKVTQLVSNRAWVQTQALQFLSPSCPPFKVTMFCKTSERTGKVQCLPLVGAQWIQIIVINPLPLCNTDTLFQRGCLLSKKGWSNMRTTDHWPKYEWLFTPFIHRKAPFPPFLLSWILPFHRMGIRNFSNHKKICRTVYCALVCSR